MDSYGWFGWLSMTMDSYGGLLTVTDVVYG